MNRSTFSMLTTLVLFATAQPSAAKPAAKPKSGAPQTTKPARPAAPAAVAEPIVTRSADGMMTPLAVKMRPMKPPEAEANAVWNIRAALNIAALQCQYSPYLATVRNYNDLLRAHSEELDAARLTLLAYFKRYDGAKAPTSFDRYTTQTYNSYSTLDAQLAFCEAAGRVGREALTVPKGALGASAARLRDEVRASLTPVAARALLAPFEIAPQASPQL